MDIIELDKNDVLDAIAEFAVCQSRLAKCSGQQPSSREKNHSSHLRDPPIGVAEEAGLWARTPGPYPPTVTDQGHGYCGKMTKPLCEG